MTTDAVSEMLRSVGRIEATGMTYLQPGYVYCCCRRQPGRVEFSRGAGGPDETAGWPFNARLSAEELAKRGRWPVARSSLHKRAGSVVIVVDLVASPPTVQRYFRRSWRSLDAVR